MLGCVHVEEGARRGGAFRGFDEELRRTREQEARRIGVAQAALVAPIEAAAQILGLGESGRALGHEAPRQARCRPIHEGGTDQGGQVRPVDFLEDRFGSEGGLHALEGGHAPPQQFGDPEPSRNPQALFVMGGFERPDAFSEPCQQRASLGRVSEQRLAQVDMCRDEAGEANESVCSEDLFPRLRLEAADFGDPPLSDPDRVGCQRLGTRRGIEDRESLEQHGLVTPPRDLGRDRGT